MDLYFKSYQDGLSAITEITNDCVDTRNNFVKSLGVMTTITDGASIDNIDDFGYTELANKDLPLRFSNGKVLNLRFTDVSDKVVKLADPATQQEVILGAYDETGTFVKELTNWCEDEGSIIVDEAVYSLDDAAAATMDSITTSEMILNLLATYQSGGNRLAAFNALVASDVNNLSTNGRQLYNQIVIGLGNVGSSPSGFLNVVRQVINSANNSYTADDSTNSVQANDTDYRVQPYAWSGILRAIGTVVSTIIVALGLVFSRLLSLLGVAIQALIQWLNTELDSLDNYKFEYDTDNYNLNVPLFTSAYSRASLVAYIEQTFRLDVEVDDEQYIVNNEIYQDLIKFTSSTDERPVMLMKTPYLDVFIWVTSEDRSNFYVEAYLSVFGLRFMPTFTGSSNPRVLQYTNGKGYLYDRYLALQNNNSFEGEVSLINDLGISEYMERNYAQFISSLILCGWYANHPDSTGTLYLANMISSSSGVLKSIAEFANSAFIIDSDQDLSRTTVDDFVNEFIYNTCRQNPQYLWVFLHWIQKFMWDQGRFDNDLFAIVNNSYPTHSFMFTAPRFGALARGALIAATIIIASVVVITFTAVKVGQICIRRGLTARYADVQKKQQKLADADPANTDDYKTKLKDFRKSVKRYNLLATLAGSSKLSKINGWEVSGDSALNGSLSELSQLSSNYINPDNSYDSNIITDDNLSLTILKYITG